MTADAAACRNLCGEHASAWIHRTGSLPARHAAHACTVRAHGCARIHVGAHISRRSGGCRSIGFAFFKPIIYQSRPPSALGPSITPRRWEEERRGAWTGDGRIRLGTIVPGRKIMRLFKGRKFSSTGERGESIFALCPPHTAADLSPYCLRRNSSSRWGRTKRLLWDRYWGRKNMSGGEYWCTQFYRARFFTSCDNIRAFTLLINLARLGGFGDVHLVRPTAFAWSQWCIF